jgi:hypothetical protein
MPELVLSLEAIHSESRYVVHGGEGLISEHKTATDAVQSLILRSEDWVSTDARVYRRGHDCWLPL